jgi:hypothetical protein
VCADRSLLTHLSPARSALQYDYRQRKGGLGRRLVEKTYLWGK